MLTIEITSLAQEDKHALSEHRFIEDTIHKAGSACNKINNKNFDIDKAKNQIENDFVALKVDGGLQALVVAQMMAIQVNFTQILRSNSATRLYNKQRC